MAYNANIPQPTDQLSTSQGDLLGNFQALATILNPNTGSFTFPVQASDPTGIANQYQLYAKAFAATSQNEIYARYASNTAYPITAAIKNTTGYTYLPSGIIQEWGIFTLPTGLVDFTVTFPLTFPTACLNVVITLLQNSTLPAPTVYVKTVAQNSFTGHILNNIPPTGAAIYYLAIGY